MNAMVRDFAGCFNEDFLVQSAGYAQTMAQAVEPYLAARRSESMIMGFEGRPLYCARYDADDARGTAVMLHGFTECADKFEELIFSLLHAGWSALAYDQRGHGRSWRPEGLAEDTLVHVDDFSQYPRDLARVVAGPLKDMPKPWVLFAHSMGGAVAAQYLEARPNTFARAVLSSPMIAPDCMGVPLPGVYLICGGARLLGRDKKRVFFSKPYAGAEKFETSCATGRARFDWYEACRAAHPYARTNGPSYGWTRQSVGVTKEILAPGKPEQVKIPVRIYSASDDHTVLPGPQQAFAKRLPNGTFKTVNGAKHEIYRSADDVLFPWWRDVLTFLDGAREA